MTFRFACSGLVGLADGMPLTGQYRPPASEFVRRQLQAADEHGFFRSLAGGAPIVIVTVRGRKSGLLRRVPVIRVEDEAGRLLMVASWGGSPKHPQWYHSVVANPVVSVQDERGHQDMRARELTGAEREQWWARAVAAFPDYAEYQLRRLERPFPLLLLEPLAD